MSPSRTGPLTFRIILRLVLSRNSTRTCVTPPREPVRPIILVTFTFLTSSASCRKATVSKTLTDYKHSATCMTYHYDQAKEKGPHKRKFTLMNFRVTFFHLTSYYFLDVFTCNKITNPYETSMPSFILFLTVRQMQWSFFIVQSESLWLPRDQEQDHSCVNLQDDHHDQGNFGFLLQDSQQFVVFLQTQANHDE